jgi:hypothetical protein
MPDDVSLAVEFTILLLLLSLKRTRGKGMGDDCDDRNRVLQDSN